MSSRSKRAILADATASSTPPTILEASQLIAQVVKAQGNSLFSVAIASGRELLVELPVKLRNVFWIKRDGYVVVDTEEFTQRDNKLGGLIVTVVMEEKAWRKMKYWPSQFTKRNFYEDSGSEEESNMGKMPPSSDEAEEVAKK